MILYLIGIDHKSATIQEREPLYRRRSEITDFWKGIGEDHVALFTCNRIELYGISEDIFSVSRAIGLFQERFPEFSEYSYVKEGRDEVIEHAFRLACGLESRIIGEKEILKQLDSWIKEDSFPLIWKNIWSEVLDRAKHIRASSGLDSVKNNIAKIVFKDLGFKKNIVIIGTGKIAQIFSENKPLGVNLYFVARKKHKKAKRLAKESGGSAVLLDDLGKLLLGADAVISATSSPHYVLRKEHFLDILQKRNRPLFLYDLAVPRDIEPGVGRIPGIFLQNLDDLAFPARPGIKVGTRPSSLALKQVEEIRRLLPGIRFDVVTIKTKGDKDKVTPLSSQENTDFFTHEIEKALLNGEIDAAIHSAKDLEENTPEELILAAVTKSISRSDSLVARENLTLDTLPTGSRIGTSSKNRRLGVSKYRKDLVTLDIRGNIDERLTQLDKGYFDAIIIAHAALIRLGYGNRISQIIPYSIIEPHPLQGRLAIQIRRDRHDLFEIFRGLNEN
ncbi:MAG: hydroxymethylbilane synthase [Candidatus Omnitrophica bacterium]|nr:hydroxymethylbilane synthase [Candidatus Omnitrophota bacterium]MBU4589435.1 hydroxymethylbilane synthase [Candidatus Omnitrophota bacterium]